MRSIPSALPALAAGLAAIVLITAPASAAPRLFSTEPALGTLRVGQRVLVDDGVCKAGEIREVVVNSRKSGDTKSYPDGGPRVRRCVKR
ncbi:DUF6719 family protein [Blastochloris tepida]|uniref:Uncharacterized protein n=1 Tax=Blastochloris tepida TaxID=2233851 RepID=A0A348G2G3_9HYPH|nr:DUF6719 family protein [Blastochloris tepida]BBF93746.1 hypothetical protein BLTE_24310 [Blastochloris tepida]